MPKLSIITVCYNNLEGLKRTYGSVVSQTARKEFEWIVIDGNSTDGTKGFLEAHSSEIDRWVSEPDTGIFNAMNKGIRMASGEYLLFMNSGDSLSTPDIIEKCITYFDGTDLIYGDQETFYPPKEERSFCKAPYPMRPMDFITATLPHQAAFIRGELHKQNPYREDVGIMGDYIFFAEMIICRNASTRKIPFSAGIFYLDGISMKDWEGMMRQREASFRKCFSDALYDDLKKLCLYELMPFTGLNKIGLKCKLVYGSIKRKLMK